MHDKSEIRRSKLFSRASFVLVGLRRSGKQAGRDITFAATALASRSNIRSPSGGLGVCVAGVVIYPLSFAQFLKDEKTCCDETSCKHTS